VGRGGRRLTRRPQALSGGCCGILAVMGAGERCWNQSRCRQKMGRSE
jgi:hypothetical protein